MEAELRAVATGIGLPLKGEALWIGIDWSKGFITREIFPGAFPTFPKFVLWQTPRLLLEENWQCWVD